MGLLLLIVLIVLLMGGLPTWGYSRNWGYGPSGGLGLVLAGRSWCSWSWGTFPVASDGVRLWKRSMRKTGRHGRLPRRAVRKDCRGMNGALAAREQRVL